MSTQDHLITREPCPNCDDCRPDSDGGESWCRRSPTGDPECDTYTTVREIEETAGWVAILLRRIGDHELRREIVEMTADGFANALHVQGCGAEFGCEFFCEACGCPRRVLA